MIFESNRANVLWWSLRKWIGFQQGKCVARVLQQTSTELHEPRIDFIGSQRRKPHLPIQPGLMRCNESRSSMCIAGLILEFIIQPIFPVIATLDNNFIAWPRHYGEQPVGIKRPQRRNPTLKSIEGDRPPGTAEQCK